MMIGRAALGRAPLFACLRSFVARGSFCPAHRCAIPYIDDVNINLTGVAFASSRIFTLSTFGSAIQARGHLGQHRAFNVAIASRSPPPSPPTGFARGRFFTSKDRPHCHRLAIARTDQPRHVERTHLSPRLVTPTERPSSSSNPTS